jgi:hypothetical protein
LHYVEVGEGPLIILLHGFQVLVRLAAADQATRGATAPSHPTCGYNLSSRPADVKDYDTTT